MAIITYPLNNIEYSAEDAELFHVTRTSGIYASNSFDYSISGADNNITIGSGIAWIKNSEFSGKVVAQKDETQVDLGIADSLYDRIDAIVLQFSANNNATNIIVKHGEPSNSPVSPSVIRSEAIYELHLYHVRRKAGAVTIAPSDITDLRLNDAYCGIMADSVTSVNTDAIEAQITSLIERLEDEISGIEGGSEFLLRSGGAPMTGNLQMGANKITGLAEPAESTDAVNLKYATDHFAPVGYNDKGHFTFASVDALDSYLVSLVASMDNHSQCSFSFMGTSNNASSPLEPFNTNHWWVTVRKLHPSNYAIIEMESYYSNVGAKARNIMSDGSLLGWEWINPPMSASVVYRTTERWGNKAVYTIRVDMGTIPVVDASADTQRVERVFTIPSLGNIVSLEGYVRSSDASKTTCQMSPDMADMHSNITCQAFSTYSDDTNATICVSVCVVKHYIENCTASVVVKFTID